MAVGELCGQHNAYRVHTASWAFGEILHANGTLISRRDEAVYKGFCRSGCTRVLGSMGRLCTVDLLGSPNKMSTTACRHKQISLARALRSEARGETRGALKFSSRRRIDQSAISCSCPFETVAHVNPSLFLSSARAYRRQ
jgi:hypothetical protein